MDANPLLYSCYIVQAFPGERTLLCFTPHVKKTQTTKKVGCRLKSEVIIFCPPPDYNRSWCCHRSVCSAGWSDGKLPVFRPPASSVCRVSLLICSACCWGVSFHSGWGEVAQGAVVGAGVAVGRAGLRAVAPCPACSSCAGVSICVGSVWVGLVCWASQNLTVNNAIKKKKKLLRLTTEMSERAVQGARNVAGRGGQLCWQQSPAWSAQMY